MNAATMTTCPSCGNEIVLGRSRVWIRPDGALAHVKCDPLPVARPRTVRASRPERRQSAPVRSGAESTARPDPRPVLVMWRRSDPFRYEVTDDSGAIVFTGPSATALSAWKRTRADVQLVNAASVFESVRGLATRVGLTTITTYGNVRAERRTRRTRKEH